MRVQTFVQQSSLFTKRKTLPDPLVCYHESYFCLHDLQASSLPTFFNSLFIVFYKSYSVIVRISWSMKLEIFIHL